MDLDQITTIIVAALSSGIFVKFIDYFIGRRKQKIDVTAAVQGVYESFVTDTGQKLTELCQELDELRAQNKKMANEIEVLRKRLTSVEDENKRLKKENALLKKTRLRRLPSSLKKL